MPAASSTVLVVIPARYGSTRFPGKPLVNIAGKSLIQRVHESAAGNRHVRDVIVATDHVGILEEVRRFGGHAEFIEESCRTGTDRVAKVAAVYDDPIVINLQADEIFLNSDLLNDLILPFEQSTATIGTLKRRLAGEQEWNDPSVVKVVTDQHDRALYFSRSPIPFVRDKSGRIGMADTHYMHLGIYIFHRETLLQFAQWRSGILEELEQLEQLRALEMGVPIQVWETTIPSFRIDTPADLAQAQESWEQYVTASHQ